jgi:hypothetical protein
VIAYKNSETFRNIIQGLWDMIKGFAGFIKDVFLLYIKLVSEYLQFVADVIKNAVIIYIKLVTAYFNFLYDAIKVVANFIKDIFIGYIDLLIGTILAVTDALKNGFISAVNFVKDKIVDLKNKIGEILNFLSDLKGKVLNKAKDIGSAIIDGIGSALSATGNFAKGIVNALITFINKNVINELNSKLSFKVAGVSVNPPDIPRIPHLAHGDIIKSPTVALIGEAGSEAVIPLTDRDRALQLLKQSGLAQLVLASHQRVGASLPAGNVATSSDNRVDRSVTYQPVINVQSKNSDPKLVASKVLGKSFARMRQG